MRSIRPLGPNRGDRAFELRIHNGMVVPFLYLIDGRRAFFEEFELLAADLIII